MANQRRAPSSKKRTTSGRAGVGTRSTEQPPQPTWRRPPPQPRERVRKAVVYNMAHQSERRRPRVRLPAVPRGLFWRSAAALLVLLVTLAGIGLALTQDLFVVKRENTRIRGNQRIPTELIYAISGLDQGNIFRLQPVMAQERVKGIPGIAAATVRLRLPNEALIDVRERAPLVAWQGITTTMWVAEDGSLIPMVGDPPALTLKDPTGAALEEISTVPSAATPSADGVTIGTIRRRVLANLAALRSTRADVTDLYYGRLEGLYFLTTDGITVYLGDDGQIARKLALLDATQREIANRHLRVQTIDLRFEYQGLAAFK
jgi:hypothetical protein